MNKFQIGDELICVENPSVLALAQTQHSCSPGGGWVKDKVFTVARINPYQHDEVYWPAVGGGIWGRFARHNSKFHKDDIVTNGHITLKVEGKLVQEDSWWLVSRKKLI